LAQFNPPARPATHWGAFAFTRDDAGTRAYPCAAIKPSADHHSEALYCIANAVHTRRHSNTLNDSQAGQGNAGRSAARSGRSHGWWATPRSSGLWITYLHMKTSASKTLCRGNGGESSLERWSGHKQSAGRGGLVRAASGGAEPCGTEARRASAPQPAGRGPACPACRVQLRQKARGCSGAGAHTRPPLLHKHLALVTKALLAPATNFGYKPGSSDCRAAPPGRGGRRWRTDTARALAGSCSGRSVRDSGAQRVQMRACSVQERLQTQPVGDWKAPVPAQRGLARGCCTSFSPPSFPPCCCLAEGSAERHALQGTSSSECQQRLLRPRLTTLHIYRVAPSYIQRPKVRRKLHSRAQPNPCPWPTGRAGCASEQRGEGARARWLRALLSFGGSRTCVACSAWGRRPAEGPPLRQAGCTPARRSARPPPAAAIARV